MDILEIIVLLLSLPIIFVLIVACVAITVAGNTLEDLYNDERKSKEDNK